MVDRSERFAFVDFDDSERSHHEIQTDQRCAEHRRAQW